MKLNAVEEIWIEIPVKVFLSLDDNKEELYDVETEFDMDKQKLMQFIEDNDLLPENPHWEPSEDEDDRYDEYRDMNIQEYE